MIRWLMRWVFHYTESIEMTRVEVQRFSKGEIVALGVISVKVRVIHHKDQVVGLTVLKESENAFTRALTGW